MRGTVLILTVIYLELPIILSAPLLHLLQPYPRMSMQASQENLQQQILELQTMQQFNPISQFGLNQPQPIIILLPDQLINTNLNTNTNIEDLDDNESKLSYQETKIKDKEDDLDTVVIDAEPMPILEEQKAFLVIPNGRLSLGDFISAIPFLPIEINVPDTISWAYDGISSGISGIISIIGSRLPFQRPTTETSMKNVNLKSMINELQMKYKNNARPILVMPLAALRQPFASL